MYIDELFNINENSDEDLMAKILNSECNQFLKESEGFPLLKNLPKSYGDFQKVKVRLKKKQDTLSEIYNKAFNGVHEMLRERAVFSNGLESFIPDDSDSKEPFFIFPINGYQYMYNPQIESSTEHNETYNKLFNLLNDKEKTSQTISELLQFTYKSTDLKEGISNGAEILFFHIPYYYVIRSAAYDSYDEILTRINK